MGVKDFYGPGMTLDTSKKMTVVTQFIGSGSTLTDIKRFYVQNGVVFKNSDSAIEGVSGNSITDEFCDAQKTAFGDTSSFKTLGGLNGMAASLARGHVLVMSLWVSTLSLAAQSLLLTLPAGRPRGEHVVARLSLPHRC